MNNRDKQQAIWEGMTSLSKTMVYTYIRKLKEVEDAFYPFNIEEGYTNAGALPWFDWDFPKIGCRFHINSSFSTSIVTEIIDKNTFKTLNSIYQFKIVDKEEAAKHARR